MPKKTKRQKQQSDLRRNMVSPVVQKISEPVMVRPTGVPNNSKPIERQYILSEYDKTLKMHTISDLRKTFIITFGLFALEFFFLYAKLNGII